MNEAQLKTRIYILRSLDWILFLAVIAFGIYAFFYAENRFMMAVITMIGLLVVHWVGNYANDKAAVMRVNLDILRKRGHFQ